jgi:uncharacterized membrane protein
MRNILIQDDLKLVEDRLKQFESRTGCDLLLVITDYSDPYPAASLRFGLVGAFVVSLAFSYYLEFHDSWMWPIFFLVLSVILTWVGHFSWAKRLALSDWETDRECREKAIEYFHTLGTSKVSHKVTAMIMLSTLEKNIQVLIDEKLKTHIDQHELAELIKLMSGHFKEGNIGLGLIKSIERLEHKILNDFAGKVSDASPSELSDTVRFINHL